DRHRRDHHVRVPVLVVAVLQASDQPGPRLTVTAALAGRAVDGDCHGSTPSGSSRWIFEGGVRLTGRWPPDLSPHEVGEPAATRGSLAEVRHQLGDGEFSVAQALVEALLAARD